MDDLISLLVIVFSVVGLINKSRQKKAKQTASQKAFRDLPPVSAPKAVTNQPSAAPEAAMLPPRPERRPLTLDEALAMEDALEESREGRTDHSAHISCEGHDPCHEDQLRPLLRPAVQAEAVLAEEEETSTLEMNFTGDDLVRAFVMKEVLTRPCERRRAM